MEEWLGQPHEHGPEGHCGVGREEAVAVRQPRAAVAPIVPAHHQQIVGAGAAPSVAQAQRWDHHPKSAPQPAPCSHGDRSDPDAVLEPEPGHCIGEDRATDKVHRKEGFYESLGHPAGVPLPVGPQHQCRQEAHPVRHDRKEAEVQELDPLLGVRAGGGRGTEEEDAPMEESSATHHHCSGMGAVDVPGGNVDSKEVGGARSGSGEGAIITWSKITSPDGEA